MANSVQARPAARNSALSYRNRLYFQWAILYLILAFIAVIVLIPMIWMFITSIKPKNQLFTKDIQWWPDPPTLDNYKTLINNPSTPIVSWFTNSVLISVIVTVLVLAVDSLAAYAYARMDFVGRNVLFKLLLFTLFLPGILFLVPNFLTVNALGLRNNYLGVILPALAGVFGVFFMRQFFETIPKELEEAAHIDGANTLQTFWSIALPLAKPALATLGVITFLGSWNDFLWPLLILQDRSLQTLPIGLRSLQGSYTSEYGLMMAGAVVAAVPVLILYVVLQRFIVASVASSGIKG
jgi:multiple sugar transport system permease protein